MMVAYQMRRRKCKLEALEALDATRHHLSPICFSAALAYE